MEVRSGYLSPLLQNLSKPLPLHPMSLNGITARRIPNRSFKNQLNVPESVIIGISESNEKIGCSKTVFERVSSGFMSYKTFLCASTAIHAKSFRTEGYGEVLFHEVIRGLSVCTCGFYLLALNPEGYPESRRGSRRNHHDASPRTPGRNHKGGPSPQLRSRFPRWDSTLPNQYSSTSCQKVRRCELLENQQK